jgi:hypothetical protein
MEEEPKQEGHHHLRDHHKQQQQQQQLRPSTPATSSSSLSLSNNNAVLSSGHAPPLTRFELVENCSELNYPRLIHPPSTWKHIQDMFILSRKILDRPIPERMMTQRKSLDNNNNTSGMLVPYVVKNDGPKGRSIHAAEVIPKGTKVWGPKYFVKVASRVEYTTFLQLFPPELQCDLLLWTYGIDKPKQLAFVTLDVGAYVNHGVGDEVNLDDECYTLRSIQPGEEFLQDYGEYGGDNPWFDEIYEKAWGSKPEGEEGKTEHPKEKISDMYVVEGAPPSTTKQNDKYLVTKTTSSYGYNDKESWSSSNGSSSHSPHKQIQFTSITVMPCVSFVILFTFFMGRKRTLRNIVTMKVESGIDAKNNNRAEGSRTTTSSISTRFIRRRVNV